MGIEDLGGALRPLGGPMLHFKGATVATKSAAYTLTYSSPSVQKLTFSGSNQDVNLPASTANQDGAHFWIHNVGATYSGVVKTSAGGTLATLAPGQFGLFEVTNGTFVAAILSQPGANGLVFAAGITYVLDMSALATGEALFKVKDNVASALDITEAANSYLKIVTTNGSERVVVAKTLKILDAAGATKAMEISAANVTGGQTRVLTMADANVDLADVATNTTNIAKFGSSDGLVRSTIAVADAPAGATVAAMSLQLTRADGTNVATARQVYIVASLTRYRGNPTGTVTFDTPTVGAIIASGTSWALVQTNATGAFACNANDAADETVYFSVTNALGGVSVVGEYAAVVGSNSDAAIWSA